MRFLMKFWKAESTSYSTVVQGTEYFVVMKESDGLQEHSNRPGKGPTFLDAAVVLRRDEA